MFEEGEQIKVALFCILALREGMKVDTNGALYIP